MASKVERTTEEKEEFIVAVVEYAKVIVELQA